MTTEKNNKTKGYILGAIAAATYGMNPLFALPLYGAGMGVDSVLIFRYLVAILILGIMLKARGHDFRISGREALPLAGFGVLFALSSITLFRSYRYMDAGIASTLLFVYPIMVALIMSLFFKERFTLTTGVCLTMALGGIALLYKGEDGATLSFIGTLMVFASSLSYAIYIVGINRTRIKTMPTIKVTFYVLVFGLAVLGVSALLGEGIQLPPSDRWYLWGNIAALGLLPTVVSLLCTTIAIQYIGSTPTAILGALEPVTAVFFGITIFGEQLTLREGIGMALILLAVTIIVAGGSLTTHLTRFRKMFPRGAHSGNIFPRGNRK